MIGTILKQVRQYRTAALLTPLWTTLEVIMGILIPYITASIIDKGIGAGNIGEVYRYGAIMIGVALLSLLFGILAARFGAYSSSGLAANLREAMYRNIQRFSFSDIDKFSTAGLVTRMTTDVSNVESAFQMLLRTSFRAPLNMISALFMCFFINGSMSVVFLVAMGILIVFLSIIIGRAVKLFRQVFLRYDDLNAVVQENISGIREVKAFVREKEQGDLFDKAATALYKLNVKTESLMALNHPVMNLVSNGSIIAISWLGAHFIVGGTLTTGQLTSLFSYVMTILSSLMMLSMIIVQLTQSFASGSRIAEVIEEVPDMEGPEKPFGEVPDGRIDFEGVSFSYSEGGAYALSDIDLHISSGETVGVIGGTGCGKSTLGSLICRLYDTTKGKVKVGGVDVRDYDLSTLRRSVAVVLQKSTLFSGTVLENLRWGREDATQEECIEACRTASADDFIREMPHGYDSFLEQGGANLSGGQRQRICLARTLLCRPKVLVIDDATSAVDSATDAAIRGALAGNMPGVTKIIISQRILSILEADRIIVMEGGKISDIGTHEQLLASSPIYRDIFQMQTSGGEGDFDDSSAIASALSLKPSNPLKS